MTTEEQFRTVMAECREVFAKKLHDYGASWRILRVPSLTDQLFIKANRIRTLETKESMVDEGIRPEFIGIVNYAIIGLIQLERGYSEKPDDMTAEQALEAYDRHAEESLQLMLRKNHDYDEVWRGMRISYTGRSHRRGPRCRCRDACRGGHPRTAPRRYACRPAAASAAGRTARRPCRRARAGPGSARRSGRRPRRRRAPAPRARPGARAARTRPRASGPSPCGCRARGPGRIRWRSRPSCPCRNG